MVMYPVGFPDMAVGALLSVKEFAAFVAVLVLRLCVGVAPDDPMVVVLSLRTMNALLRLPELAPLPQTNKGSVDTHVVGLLGGFTENLPIYMALAVVLLCPSPKPCPAAESTSMVYPMASDRDSEAVAVDLSVMAIDTGPEARIVSVLVFTHPNARDDCAVDCIDPLSVHNPMHRDTALVASNTALL